LANGDIHGNKSAYFEGDVVPFLGSRDLHPQIRTPSTGRYTPVVDIATCFTISYTEAVCVRIREQSPQARKPSTWGMLGPVRALLGGLASPAASLPGTGQLFREE
jgi:hypothetical protein